MSRLGWIASAVLWSCVVATMCGSAASSRATQAIASAAPASLPETPRLRHFGVAEGLPSSNINALAQDAQGYLWIASDDGLARFDGVGFHIWRHVPDDPASLPGNIVQAVHVDARDRVWVALEGQGLAMLETEGVHFRQYRHANMPAIGVEDVFAIASTIDPISRKGAIWFGTFGGGLYRMANDGHITHFSSDLMKKSHIALDNSHKGQMQGPGGDVATINFTTSITVGTIRQNKLPAMLTPSGDQYGIFPFAVGGTVSHEFFRKRAVSFDFEAMQMVVTKP